VTICRAQASSRFPADFMLVAAFNPCPCGYRGDSRRDCQCSAPQVEKYMGKISGPLLDRIDIQLEVPAVSYRDLAASRSGTSSAAMREAVMAARACQARRFGTDDFHADRESSAGSVSAVPVAGLGTSLPVRCNARMNARQIRQFCRLEPAASELLRAAVSDLGLSARAHDRILRVARTIADLASMDARGKDQPIGPADVSEAINYRLLDRSLWA
jgi:magnesium chelatase family protein